jgi:hypothetical protein
MRRWLIGLALLGSVLVVTLFALEFAMSKFAPHSRTLHKMNSHGFRDKERTYEKKEGVYRILVLGDSMTKGLQVPIERNYTNILETMLNSETEGGNRVEVINLGVAKFNTAKEYLIFRSYGIKYQPDLVILAFFNGDDMLENSLVLKKALAGGEGGEISSKLKHVSMLSNGKVGEGGFEIGVYDSVNGGAKRDRNRVSQFIKRTSAGLLPNIYYSSVGWLKYTPLVADFFLKPGGVKSRPKRRGDPISYGVYAKEYSPKWQNEWDVTKSLILRLADELRVSGTGFLVVIVPAEFEFRADKWDKVLHKNSRMRSIDFDVRKPERILTGFLEANGIDYLLLRPEFEEYVRETGKDLHFNQEGEIHWNSNGHAIAAQLIYGKLKEDYRLIPRATYTNTTFKDKSCAAQNPYISLSSSDCSSSKNIH